MENKVANDSTRVRVVWIVGASVVMYPNGEVGSGDGGALDEERFLVRRSRLKISGVRKITQRRHSPAEDPEGDSIDEKVCLGDERIVLRALNNQIGGGFAGVFDKVDMDVEAVFVEVKGPESRLESSFRLEHKVLCEQDVVVTEEFECDNAVKRTQMGP